MQEVTQDSQEDKSMINDTLTDDLDDSVDQSSTKKTSSVKNQKKKARKKKAKKMYLDNSLNNSQVNNHELMNGNGHATSPEKAAASPEKGVEAMLTHINSEGSIIKIEKKETISTKTTTEKINISKVVNDPNYSNFASNFSQSSKKSGTKK